MDGAHKFKAGMIKAKCDSDDLQAALPTTLLEVIELLADVNELSRC